MNQTDRYSRQDKIVPAARLADMEAAVIGVGAIGRNVALQLAAIGLPRLQLIDFDVVDETNVVTQGFRQADVGRTKVTAVADAVRQLNPHIIVDAITDRFRPRLPIKTVCFCCVDSIAARAAIWRAIRAKVRFWADGRMLGEVMRVLIAADDHGRVHYPSTLFAPSEAQAGSCTARTTIYAATIAAGLMVHQFTRWLRDLPIDIDTSINLLAGEWVAVSG
jgi:molybdopterin/thiamine biosynthesis adenylyltransferase